MGRCKRLQEYIHYGSKKYDPLKFIPVQNQMFDFKPSGGLWASPINAPFGWKEWNGGSNYRVCSEGESFKFTLTKTANVYHINSSRDLAELPKDAHSSCLFEIMPSIMAHHTCLDFEKILQNGVDALQLNISNDDAEVWEERLTTKLQCWDCDTIFVMNKDIIITLP